MKSTIKKIITGLSNNDIAWKILRPFALLGFYAVSNRRKPAQQVIDHTDDPLMSIFKKTDVLYGPFKGMKYPSSSSVGSSFYPKLLGSYERELHETISTLLEKNYTDVLDIGCAEGYYAIGLGLKLPKAKVYAYDTDETARQLCLQMAKLNNIEKQVIIKKTCTPEDLAKFEFTGKSLIICDCEGYEDQLFDQTNIGNLNNCDLLIETHDFLNLNISGNLIQLFADTHNVQVVKSIDDIEKAQTYIYAETDGLNLRQKFELYRECRPSIMSWLIFTPKNTSSL